MLARRLLFVLMWGVVAGTAFAVSAPASHTSLQPLQVPEDAAPTFTVYDGRDGLGDDIWSTIGFDQRGFVWAGSAASLAWFDGYAWHMWPLPHSPSLVRDMAVANDGTLWAIFEHGGLARFDGHEWKLIDKPQFFQRFATIATANGHALWAIGKDHLMTLQDGVWRADPGDGGSSLPEPTSFGATQTLFGAPRQWYGSFAGGLWYRLLKPDGAPGRWQRFDRKQINDMPVTDLLASVNDAGQEELWVASYGGGLARIRDDGIRVWSADAGELPSGALYSIVETHNDAGQRRLWVASRGGLLRIRDDGEHIDVFDRRNGLPSNAVRGVKVQHLDDGSTALWLATEGGIARAVLNDSPWRTVSRLGAEFNGTFGLMLEPDGPHGKRLWVGSAKDGLAMLDQGKWRRFNKENGALPSNAVRGIWQLPDENGDSVELLSLIGAGLFKITDDLAVVPMTTPWPLHADEAASDALARSEDGKREWWVSTLRDGIYRLRDGQWKSFPIAGASHPERVTDLEEQVDADGKSWLWAATSQGLARFDGKSWQLLQKVPGLPTHGFYSVTLFDKTRTQQLWVGSFHDGYIRLDVSNPRAPQLLDNKGIPPLPDQTVYSILHDSQGRVYICTNNGVQQLTPLPQGGYSSRVFDRGDGMVSDECNSGSQLLDERDRYWVGTLGGVSMYDPGVEPGVEPGVAEQKPDPLYLTSLRVNGQTSAFPGNAPLDLPPGDNQMQIQYALLSGQREEESQYQTQLVGYETQPSAWTGEHARSFSNLPPGDYQLRIEARDFDGTASMPLSLNFSVKPYWWQQRSWQIAIAVLALLSILTAVMAYNRGLRLRQRQLRAVVAERTKALRIANKKLTELSYLDPLTGIANRRRILAALDDAIVRARKKRLPIGLILFDIDRFKDYNDRHGHLAGDTALRAVAKLMAGATREQDLAARLGGEEFVFLMTDATLDDVTRIAERIRSLVAALTPRAIGNETETITLSAGVLSLIPHTRQLPESLIAAVDAAMYEAKASGRDRVVQNTARGLAPVETSST